jgi:polyhydroxyalkanoate synthesis regulator protein
MGTATGTATGANTTSNSNALNQGFSTLEAMGKQQMALVEKAMSMFIPFATKETSSAPLSREQLESEVQKLRTELSELRNKS